MIEDPYLDPLTGVLRNRLGCTEADQLAQAEADLSYAALAELDVHSLPGRYDLHHLQEFHRYIFRDIYAWAGELRTVVIAKSAPFCLPQFIEVAGEQIFGELADVDRYLHGLCREPFVARLVHHYAEVNALHPFREGNGRSQRAFFRQLAADAGWRLDWSQLDAHRNIAASAASMSGDLEPLTTMLDQLITPIG